MPESNTVPALLAICGRPRTIAGSVDPVGRTVAIDGRSFDAASIDWDVPPVGCVYGAALNYRAQLAELEPVFSQPPHGAPPRAPVLYIKPRNTWLACGRPVPLPHGVDAVEVGATLGVVFSRDARRVPREAAAEVIAGYTIVNDVTIPQPSLFRPPLRYKCRDGFCPIGPWIVPHDAMPSAGALGIRTFLNGTLQSEHSTAGLQRGIEQLIADVTEFMTLRAGDVLTVGVPSAPPLARAGDLMSIEIDGIGRLENRLVTEASVRESHTP